MTAPLILGIVLGLGAWCLLRAVIPNPPPLNNALGDLARPRWHTTNDAAAQTTIDGAAHRVGSQIMSLFGAEMRNLSADLAVMGRSEEVHLIERMKTAAFYGGLPPLFWILPATVSGVSLFSPVLAAVGAVGGAVTGWFLTDGQLRTKATTRRKEFDASLVTYLGLVSILVAGGAGIQQALQEAVDQGEGWPFHVLRRTLTDARVRAVSPWQAMAEHGERLNLDSLIELSSTMELAGTSGAHIRESLQTKAKALRNHHITEIEREATGRTTAMAGPTGLMMAGFVVLLIYPALRAVLAL